MLTLVARIEDVSDPSPEEYSDPCLDTLNALLCPFMTPTDTTPLNPALGFFLSTNETLFLVDELGTESKIVSAIQWRMFDSVRATELIYRLTQMNAEECLAFTNECQADSAHPRLTSRLMELGREHKRCYRGKPPRAFVAALYATLLTL